MSIRTRWVRPGAMVFVGGVLTVTPMLPASPGAAEHRDRAQVAAGPGTAGMLAYSDGNILTIWTDGSHRRQLTTNGGGNPAWSSSGAQIAYEVYDRPARVSRIRLMSASGADDEAIAEGHEPAWAPDDQSLSYVCGVDGEELCVLDLQTMHERVVVTRDPLWQGVGAMDWSPDGSWIVFTRVSVSGPDAADRYLFLVHADGTGLTVVPNTRPTADMPVWSPDGSTILYAERDDSRDGEFSGDLFTIRPDGSERNVVTETVGTDHDASWAPDGRHFAMASEGALYPEKSGIWVGSVNHSRPYFVGTGSSPDWRPGFARSATPPPAAIKASGRRIAYVARSGAGFDLFTVRPDGTGRHRVTSFGDVRHPAWSPDHSKIAFFRSLGRDFGSTLWLYNRETGVTRRLAQTNNADGGIAWSPGARRLAWGDSDGLNMYTLRTGHRRPLPVPLGCCTRDPSWAPDGRLLAFSHKVNRRFDDIMTIAPTGKALRRVAKLRKQEVNVDWAPAGRQIVFTHNTGPGGSASESAIRRMRSDGKLLRKLADWPALDLDPSWSPDGRRIAYYSDGPNPFGAAPRPGLWTMSGNGMARQLVVRDRSIAYVDW